MTAAKQAVCGDCHGVVRAPRGVSLEAVLRIHKDSCPNPPRTVKK